MTDQEIKEVTLFIREQIAAAGSPEHKKQFERLEVRLNALERRPAGLPGARTADVLRQALMGTKELLERPADPPRGMRFQFQVETKDIIGLSVQMPQAVAIATIGQPQLRVANLIPSSEITSGSIEYPHEDSFTNSAAAVTEGELKPQSEKVFSMVTSPVETIAHWFRVSLQCFQDLPQLVQVLSTNLIYGLNAVLETEILKGSGARPHLVGIYPKAPAAAAVPGTPNLIDKFAYAVGEVSQAGYTPNAIVMSSADYVSLRLLKDKNDNYLLNNLPALPSIVQTPALAAGEWIVGDWSQAHLFYRQQATVQASREDGDNFRKNLVTMLGEMRVVLATWQINAFRKNQAAA